MKKIISIISLCLLITVNINAQKARKKINIPDLPGYQTLFCDFHMHTVFSDGLVWPTVRVDEAWSDGLDAIAITEHLEDAYTSFKDDINIDVDRPYEIALNRANLKGIILIKAIEITRQMPPGHFNALFIKDANKISRTDDLAAIEEAYNQGAYIFWNHPGWKRQSPEGPTWYDIHTTIYNNGWMHGIEVSNWDEWYPEVLDWAIDKNLTVLGNSDAHDPISTFLKNKMQDHRPITMVFAKEKSQKGIKEALLAKRTAIWFNKLIIGKEEFLAPLFKEIVLVEKMDYTDEKSNYYELTNTSELEIQLLDHNETKIIIPSQSSVIYKVKKENVTLDFTILNFIIKQDSNLKVSFDLNEK